MYETLNFKFPLQKQVYWLQNGKPTSGRIMRRGYQETWHDPDPEDPEGKGGYLTNNFYEAVSVNGKAIFHESDFGRKCFADAAEFAVFITQPA